MVSIYSATILTFAYFIRIFEKPYYRATNNPLFDSYFESVWFTVVTSTTIGYGDVSPGTSPGKLAVIILAFWSAFLTSLLIVTMDGIFQMSTNQKIAMKHIKLTRKAAVAITKGIKYFRAKKDLHFLLK